MATLIRLTAIVLLVFLVLNTIELHKILVSNKKESEFQVPRSAYEPCDVERHFLDRDKVAKLRFNWTEGGYQAITCDIWTHASRTTPKIHDLLTNYSADLDGYATAIKSFEPVPDLLSAIKSHHGRHDICRTVRPHPHGLRKLFPSNQLSLSSSGWIDPILPTQRHHKFCVEEEKYVTSLDYLVHDFEAMCYKLKPTSRRVLIDMGASLDFHNSDDTPPMIELLELYEKFGFNFDHIYAFEITKYNPDEVFGTLLPEKYMASYHWINTGVNPGEKHKLNPLHSILKKFDEDDFVVVKLDIDNSPIEGAFVRQLLSEDVYGRLIDQFYFEDHVKQREMAKYWLGTAKGTVEDTLHTFYNLRKKGIPAHHWV